MLEPCIGDMTFVRCLRLAEMCPHASDRRSFFGGRTPNFLLFARLGQRDLCGHRLKYAAACVGTHVKQQHLEQQQQQPAEEAGRSSKLFVQNLAYAGMAPCQRLTQTDLACCSLLRFHSHHLANSAVSAPRKLPMFNSDKASKW